MKKIILIMIITAATYIYKPELFSFIGQQGAFDEQGNAVTLMFTHKKCGKPCAEAITLLNRRGVRFTEYKLDGDVANQKLWKQYGGVNTFPNMIIGNEKVYGSYKGMIVSGLAVAYGESALTSSERYYMNQHFYNDGKPKLVVYGTSWCPHCKKLRQGLNKENISFVEIDVEKSAQKMSIIKTMDIGGYPVVYYGYKRIKGTRLKEVKAAI